jgi:predicted AAA+ superfamily ATPase
MAAFQTYPGRDLGHKLETVVFLENRRRQRDLFYYVNGSEVDLCDGDGKFFINTCWRLTEPETRRREKAAMELGFARWPNAQGRLLYHEYSAVSGQEMPGAVAAWRYLLDLE